MFNGLARRVILASRPGCGILIGLGRNKAQHCWRDLEGVEIPDILGANQPTLTAYRGAVRENAFGVNDMIDVKFHVPHDMVPGSPWYLHLHWSHNGTGISGQFQAECAYSYSKGHDQDEFCEPKLLTFTDPTPNITNCPQYRHRIPELQMSDFVDSDHASLLNISDIEVDGLILLNCKVTEKPAITGGSADPFIHRVDIHYLSTNIGTLNKAPYFYGR